MTPADKIRTTIAAKGPITFAEFMRSALYDPASGYYTSGRVKIGPAGDFVTSPHVSSLFGTCIANLARKADNALGHPPLFTLIESGPGEGKLAADALNAIKAGNPELYARLAYVPIEVSPALAARQSQALANHAEKIHQVPPVNAVGLHLSNEVADALPVNVLQVRGGDLNELCVDTDDNGFAWAAAAKPESVIASLAGETLTALSDTAEQSAVEEFRLEVCAGLGEWLKNVSQTLARGFIVTIDYGDDETRLYGPHKPLGTLRGFRDGAFVEDVLSAPGEADLTASVNFSALKRRGAELGLASSRLYKQWEFLFALGITGELEALEGELADEVEILKLRQEVMPLIFPGVGMGEIFKALVMGKNITPETLGL